MRKYLHTPVRETGELARFIAASNPEGEQLDYKAAIWSDGLEFAKDVAALANHLGGDLILGISDRADCAAGWNPIDDSAIPGTVHRLKQWLINHLRPHEFSEAIDMVSVPAPTVGRSVLVISVPPSPQLVGTENRNSDRIDFRFPIRTGRRTRALTYEEVMQRISSEPRRAYLKLVALAKPGTDTVRFGSAVLVVAGDARLSMPTRDGRQGRLDAFDESVLALVMAGSFQPVLGSHRPPGTNYETAVSVTVPPDHRLVVPLETVRAVWRDPTEADILYIALDGPIVWDGMAWRLAIS